MSCENHPKDLLGEADMSKVAQAIGDLNYETFYFLFDKLANKLMWDAEIDFMGERKQLFENLKMASHLVRTASIFIQKAAEISKPFMQNDKQKQSL